MPAGYGWSFPAARRGADRRRLLRPPLPRQGHRPCCSPRTSTRRRSATRATGSPTSSAAATEDGDLLRRRLRRALPAADRRGHPHRLLLRRRPRRELRAVVGGRQDPRAGAARLRRLQRRARVEVPLDAARPAAGAAPSRPPAARRHSAPAASASSTGPSATTCRSRRPATRTSTQPFRKSNSRTTACLASEPLERKEYLFLRELRIPCQSEPRQSRALPADRQVCAGRASGNRSRWLEGGSRRGIMSKRLVGSRGLDATGFKGDSGLGISHSCELKPTR